MLWCLSVRVNNMAISIAKDTVHNFHQHSYIIWLSLLVETFDKMERAIPSQLQNKNCLLKSLPIY